MLVLMHKHMPDGCTYSVLCVRICTQFNLWSTWLSFQNDPVDSLREEVHKLRKTLEDKEAREQQLTDILKEKEEELKEIRKVHFISVTFCTQTHKRFEGSYICAYVYHVR